MDVGVAWVTAACSAGSPLLDFRQKHPAIGGYKCLCFCFCFLPTVGTPTGCGASSRPLCFDALKIMQVGERRARDNTPKKLIAGGLSCRFLYFHYNPARVPNADGLT